MYRHVVHSAQGGHRLLDRGAFTVTASGSRERVVEVSERARGNEGFQQWMLAYGSVRNLVYAAVSDGPSATP